MSGGVVGRSDLIAGRFEEGVDGSTARDVETGAPVRLERGPTDEIVWRAGVGSRLRHPAAPRVLGVWADAVGAVLVLDAPGGTPVSDLGRMSLDEAVRIAVEVGDALIEAHAVGVCHGSLGPSHVFVGAGGVRVVGFGSREAIPGVTAPEGPGGAAADGYGLGVLLFRLLVGRAPFPEHAPWRALAAQAHGGVTPPGVPADLARLVASLLDPDPACRPEVAEAVAALRRHLRGESARVRRRWLAPLKPGRAWVVRGTDPSSGADVLLGVDLSSRAARRLRDRAVRAGVEAEMVQEGLGARDLALVAVATVAAGVVLPVIGAPVGGALALAWSSGRCRPEVRRVVPLAPDAVAVLARAEPSGALRAAVVAAAFLLVVAPPAGLVLAAALGIGWAWSARRSQVSDGFAGRARAEAAVVEARHVLSAHDVPADAAIELAAEVDELERSLVSGAIDPRRVAADAETVVARVRRSAVRALGGSSAVEALRRTAPAVDGVPPVPQDRPDTGHDFGFR